MTLPQLCERFFHYMCRLNRSARKKADLNEIKVRTEILQIMKELDTEALKHPSLHEQWKKIELPLLFFADATIAESKLSFASRWNNNRLAFDRKELAGDEKFFDMLEDTMRDPTEEATERLKIFYTCIGLGFTGWYAGQIDYLQAKMKEIASRIGLRISTAGAKNEISPEAYGNVDTRNLVEPPGGKMAGLVLTMVLLTVFMLVMNMLIFKQAGDQIRDYLAAIKKFPEVLKEEATEQPAPPPRP